MNFFDLFDEFLNSNFHKNEDYEKETFEVVKNGVKTTIDVLFNKKGYVVKTILNSTNQNVTKLQEIEEKLKKAVENEDYESALLLKKEKEEVINKKN